MISFKVGYSFGQEKESTTMPKEEAITIGDRFKQLNFNEADWTAIQSDIKERLRLTNDWAILSELDPEEGLIWFYTQILEVCELFTPKKKAPLKDNSRKIPYH